MFSRFYTSLPRPHGWGGKPTHLGDDDPPGPEKCIHYAGRLKNEVFAHVLISIVRSGKSRVLQGRMCVERERLIAQAEMYAWLEKLIKLKLCYDE